MDEDAKQVVNEEVQAPEEPQQEAPEAPEIPEVEPSQPEEEPQAAEQEEVANEDPEPMSRRKAKRLEKLEGLVERLRGQEQRPQPKGDGINYRDIIDADDEVYKQLDAKAQEFGQNQFNQGLEHAKSIQFQTRLEIDAPRVEAKYPIFDKESPEFNPAVADSVNQWFLASVGYDPQTGMVKNANVRYAEFVEGIMELADNMAGQKTVQTAKNIAKQAASTGLRPDGSRAKGMDLSKHPSDMSTEELEAAVKASLPRDAKGRFTN